MSENTLTLALRTLGYAGDVMTAPGFRSMASTLLNEQQAWHPDAIERHQETPRSRRLIYSSDMKRPVKY
jgi:hypothetical protein